MATNLSQTNRLPHFSTCSLITLILWLLPTAFLMASVGQTEEPRRPNLLILMADDHAAYTMGVDGDRHNATPRLDKLAREGTYFSRSFCVSPLCTPSRQAFLTGQYPHAVGVTSLLTPLSPEKRTMAAWLSQNGYATAAIGKMHFNNSDSHGFQQKIDTPAWERHLRKHPPAHGEKRPPWQPFKDSPTTWLNAQNKSSGLNHQDEEATFFVETASRYIHHHRDQPFFLVLSLHEPHAPFCFPVEWQDRYQPDRFPSYPLTAEDVGNQPAIFQGLSPDDQKGIQAAYYTSLRYADSQLGRIVDVLDTEGLSENTLVVYWSDNGYFLGQHGRFEKHAMYEEAVRVPFIVRWPGKLPASRRVDELLESIDIFPTLMTLLGLPIPSSCQGRDLAPLVRNETGAKGRSEVFSEYLDNEEAMIRNGRYKLVISAGQHERTDGYTNRHPPRGRTVQLFDLIMDPGETTNLSQNLDQQPRIQAMRRMMLDRFRQTWPAHKPIGYIQNDIEELDEYLMSSEVRQLKPKSR